MFFFHIFCHLIKMIFFDIMKHVKIVACSVTKKAYPSRFWLLLKRVFICSSCLLCLTLRYFLSVHFMLHMYSINNGNGFENVIFFCHLIMLSVLFSFQRNNSTLFGLILIFIKHCSNLKYCLIINVLFLNFSIKLKCDLHSD